MGLVAKSAGLPRGFVLDDGMAHFFAGQIIDQDRDACAAFMDQTAYVFLMPDDEKKSIGGPSRERTQADIYLELFDLVRALGLPTILLKRSDRTINPGLVKKFIEQELKIP